MVTVRHPNRSRPRRGRWWLAFALLAWAAGGAPVAAAGGPRAPRVTLASGVLQGRWARVDGTRLGEFRGVPYAAAPVGRRRWRPPQPVAAWTGVRDASHFAARCMQLPLFGDMVFRADGMSEDCLYLNVWTPASSSQVRAKLPVLVYFFGGGFVAGDGSEPRYDGASLAARGLVIVTVNYRLGVFGFLALPALAAESPRHAAGDYGLLDQVAALKWVRANIARFGGDPRRITIGGESAGSISASALMVSPLARSLIAGAIGESGAMVAPLGPQPLAEAERRGEAFAAAVGARSLAALRAMSASTLLRATAPAAERNFAFSPDVDGYFLTESPARSFARGAQARVPLLVGGNSAEGAFESLLGNAPPTPANYRAALEHRFGPLAGRAAALYPGPTVAAVRHSAAALAGDLFIAHTTWRWMDLARRGGKAPVYFYYFDKARPPPRHPAPGETNAIGAVHSGEIEYALGNLGGNTVYAWTPADFAVSRTMEGYFARFIATGNPNGPGLPVWPAARTVVGGVSRQTIGIDTRTTVDRNALRQAFLMRYFAARPSIR